MSKKQKQFCLTLLAIVILLLIWLSKKHPAISQNLENGGVAGKNTSAQIEKTTPPIRTPVTLAPTNEYQQILPQNEQKKQSMAQEALLWRTPILYYGKVVDESNQPIMGVQVSFNTSSVNESLTKEQYDTGTVTTDNRGIFKIDGVHGVGMVFQLSHPNYYSYPENITDYDIRDYPKKGALPNTEDTALVFRMHSKGHPVRLIFRSGGFHAPNDGSIANFPLRGNTRAEILGQLQVQGWSGIRSDTNPYDWKVQLTMPEGGIIESTNYFDFLAPETGYSESVDFQISGGEMARKQYFLKLPSGYVRFKLEVIMGKDMFVSGDYYYNPDGSQNLEPGQEIHPTQ